MTSRVRVLVVPIAFAVHALILAGVAVGQYWSIDPIAEPLLQVSFVDALRPPPALPAAPPPPAGRSEPEPEQVAEIVAESVQPIQIPDEISAAPDLPEAVGARGGVPWGVPEGVPGSTTDGAGRGVPHGVPYGVPDGGSAPVIRVEGDVEKPEVLERVQPAYTESGRRARVQGIVIVETIIDTDGRVTDVRVLKSLSMGLTEAAVDAVKQWRFKPASLNGRPVSVYFTLTVRFELQ